MHKYTADRRNAAHGAFNSMMEEHAIIRERWRTGTWGDVAFSRAVLRWLINEARQDRLKGVNYPRIP